MLAMDVVDTLRHREHLVERELHAEDRDEVLLKRLREIYASQGMEVPDRVLKEGVAALREERFVYKPPEEGLAVKLARKYIERGKWFKRLSAAVAALLVSWGSYTFLVSAPAERELQQQAEALNSSIRSAGEQIDVLEKKAQRLQTQLASVTDNVPPALQDAAQAKQTTMQQSLGKAATLIASARELTQPADIDTASFDQRSGPAGSRLQQQQQQNLQIEQQLATVERSLDEVASLQQLPSELAAVRDATLKASRDEAVSARARQLYDLGLSALGAGDVDQAVAAAEELKALRARLGESYTLRIVSRPGEKSGLWRVPEGNPDARNYYIIVEAIGADGKVLTQEITSEEDGSTRAVDVWGVRVDKPVFNRIAADKQNDGIIQNSRFGEKRRGYLEDEYSVETSGGTITRW
jgi:chaperonin cofactor prefoldin